MGKRYKRLGFTEAQSIELWDRWQQGESLKSIGRDLGKPSSCIWGHLKPHGGDTAAATASIIDCAECD